MSHLSVALHEHADGFEIHIGVWRGYDGIYREEKANDSLVTRRRGLYLRESVLQTQPEPTEDGSSDQVRLLFLPYRSHCHSSQLTLFETE